MGASRTEHRNAIIPIFIAEWKSMLVRPGMQVEFDGVPEMAGDIRSRPPLLPSGSRDGISRPLTEFDDL